MLVYRGLQVGCHKFATKIRACATFGGDFELKIPHMREFSSQICANQPANLCNNLLLSSAIGLNWHKNCVGVRVGGVWVEVAVG